MNFHKLSNFQLYSIIHSRHLDAAQKAVAEKELESRGLQPDEIEQLADELKNREKSFTKIGPNIIWLIAVMAAMMVLRQWSCN